MSEQVPPRMSACPHCGCDRRLSSRVDHRYCGELGEVLLIARRMAACREGDVRLRLLAREMRDRLAEVDLSVVA